MGMTMSQKILAKHAGLPEVREGQLIRAKLDMVLANDITGPVAINEFNKAGFDGVFETKTAVVASKCNFHFISSPSLYCVI